MRRCADIKTHLSIEKMFEWLQNASDEWSYKRRLAIWLTYTGKMNAGKVAEILQVSKQSIWLWIGQYNKYGPNGLEREGRGGRRWGFLSIEQESEILKPFFDKVRSGNNVKAAEIKKALDAQINRTVSMSYTYRLLQRHGWAELIAQSRGVRESTYELNSFERYALPWQRSD